MALPNEYLTVFMNIALPNAERGVNTFHYIIEGGVIEGDGQEVVDLWGASFKDIFEAPYRAVLSQEVQLETALLSLSTSFGTYVRSEVLDSYGLLTGDMCPNYVAAIIERRVLAPGREAIGRIFVPGIAEESTNTNKLTEAAILGFQGIRDAMMTPLVGFGPLTPTPALRGRKSAVLRPLVSCRVIDNLGSMRTRKAKR